METDKHFTSTSKFYQRKDNEKESIIKINKALNETLEENKKLKKRLNEQNKIVYKLNNDLKDKTKQVNFFTDELILLFTHELKTPLNAIINFSDYIHRSLDKELDKKRIAKLKLLTNRIKENGLNQLNMVENMLQIAKTNADTLQVIKENFNIKKLILSVLDKYKDICGRRFECNIDGYIVQQDYKKLEIIIDNIISNAVKYSDSKIMIIFSKYNPTQIVVEDDGSGIKDEEKDKIFNLFEQLDKNVLTRSAKGTGIGLYITKKLCEMINCSIKVKDSQKLKGAKFIIELGELR